MEKSNGLTANLGASSVTYKQLSCNAYHTITEDEAAVFKYPTAAATISCCWLMCNMIFVCCNAQHGPAPKRATKDIIAKKLCQEFAMDIENNLLLGSQHANSSSSSLQDYVGKFQPKKIDL